MKLLKLVNFRKLAIYMAFFYKPLLLLRDTFNRSELQQF